MALSRRNGKRFEANIWPGFVDAMTALLLVLVFVLSIFMIVQFMLSEKITSQDSELNQLTGEVASLAQALGLEQQRSFGLEQNIEQLDAAAAQQAALITSLTSQNQAQTGRIASFEEQVAGLLRDREGLQSQVASLSGELDASQTQVAGLSARIEDIEAGLAREISEKEAAQLALASARAEIDEGVEAARLAAARREALEALVADLETQSAAQTEALSAAEAAKLVDAAAAQALRDRLQNADAELTAMTLALEAQRKDAEDTLTLLAAARASQTSLDAELAAALAAKIAAETGVGEALSEAEQRATLLALARTELADEKEISLESQRKVEALNQQVAALRTQLGSLQSILDDTDARREASDVQVQNLGSELNSALALVASEQRARARLEEAERLRLEAEAKELKNYRSEFFGQLRSLLGSQDGIRIEGDRFVFSSEVLFQPGQAVLSAAGRGEVAKVAAILSRVAGEIPDSLDWVIRVDGHTDNVPLSGTGQFKDNWELSQARALSVVRYMSAELGIPPARLAANGFGEFQPVNLADTPEARAQNRRIELKLTEK